MTSTIENTDDFYIYKQLESFNEETRLLSLAPGVNSEYIHCSLSVVSLNKSVSFDALSYVWGSDEKPNFIYVSGKKFSVTANLYRALLHFRDPLVAQTMWIDAICINQDNVPERNQQVRIMRRIYATANEVLVWLGEEEETDRLALDMIERFTTVSSPWLETEDNTVHTFEELLQPLAPAGAPEWSALAQFLQRPWFSRVWTIQEVSVSTKPTIVCGSRKVSWESLARITRYIRDKTLTAYFGTTETVTGLLTVPLIHKCRHVLGSSEHPGLVLLDLLLRTMVASFATDPRDRVFALMGIVELNHFVASGLNPQIKSPYSSITIDYSLSCAEVYAMVAKYMLLEAHEMCFLSCAGARMWPSTLGLPSWVPDWNFRDVDYVTPSLAFVPHFKFAGDSKANVSVSEGRILSVEGGYIDKIARISSKTRTIVASGEKVLSPEKQPEYFRQRLEFIQDCDNVIRGDDPEAALPDDYWRILVCDVTQGFTQAPPEYADGYDLFRFALDNYPSVYDGSDTHEARMTHIILQSALYQRYVLSHQQWTRGRLLFSTEFGSIGWAPRGAEIGDVICWFKGSSVPFVLRPLDKEYKLVGEAYLHNSMEGELMNVKNMDSMVFCIL